MSTEIVTMTPRHYLQRSKRLTSRQQKVPARRWCSQAEINLEFCVLRAMLNKSAETRQEISWEVAEIWGLSPTVIICKESRSSAPSAGNAELPAATSLGRPLNDSSDHHFRAGRGDAAGKSLTGRNYFHRVKALLQKGALASAEKKGVSGVAADHRKRRRTANYVDSSSISKV